MWFFNSNELTDADFNSGEYTPEEILEFELDNIESQPYLNQEPAYFNLEQYTFIPDDLEQEFIHFLKNICDAQDVKNIYFNDDTSQKYLGIRADFRLKESSLKQFLIEMKQEWDLNDLFYQDLEFILTENQKSLQNNPKLLMSAMKDELKDHFNNENSFFEITVSNEYPLFSLDSICFNMYPYFLPNEYQQKYIRFKRKCEFIFYSLFKKWFDFYFQKKIEKEEELAEINEIKNKTQRFKRKQELETLLFPNNQFMKKLIFKKITS